MTNVNQNKHPAIVEMADCLTSLQRVVAYLGDDEHTHWEENGKPDDHIWNDVEQCRQLLWVLDNVFEKMIKFQEMEVMQ